MLLSEAASLLSSVIPAGTPERLHAVFDPVDQRREEIEIVEARAAGSWGILEPGRASRNSEALPLVVGVEFAIPVERIEHREDRVGIAVEDDHLVAGLAEASSCGLSARAGP